MNGYRSGRVDFEIAHVDRLSPSHRIAKRRRFRVLHPSESKDYNSRGVPWEGCVRQVRHAGADPSLDPLDADGGMGPDRDIQATAREADDPGAGPPGGSHELLPGTRSRSVGDSRSAAKKARQHLDDPAARRAIGHSGRRFGRIDRRIGEPPCARRCRRTSDRPTHPGGNFAARCPLYVCHH